MSHSFPAVAFVCVIS